MKIEVPEEGGQSSTKGLRKGTKGFLEEEEFELSLAE